MHKSSANIHECVFYGSQFIAHVIGLLVVGFLMFTHYSDTQVCIKAKLIVCTHSSLVS